MLAVTCREAERLVMPYINGSITDEELKEFLKHIETCEECREELEIYFTVDVGIRQLDQETGTYNIKGALETALELSRQRVHTLGIPIKGCSNLQTGRRRSLLLPYGRSISEISSMLSINQSWLHPD